ncbi:hypothetical protein HmCmsJML025_03034 [Escherichia coli]|nr:hypothetical protein HmCmsJML025_03034 [Escherichia coli]
MVVYWRTLSIFVSLSVVNLFSRSFSIIFDKLFLPLCGFGLGGVSPAVSEFLYFNQWITEG